MDRLLSNPTDLRWGMRKKMRHVKEYKGEDRISSLPDDVMHLILKFLPDTKSAVQTSVLSKRWKFIWTTLPFLKFECPLGGSSKSSTSLARHILKHRNHESSISYLKITHLPPVLTDKYIDYAVSHNVEDLKVYIYAEHKAFKLCKFSSNSITKLALKMKIENMVEESDCWDLPALRKLYLYLFPTNDDNRRVLSVRCLTCLPALRTLSLHWEFEDPDLFFSLPELTTLCLSMCKMPQKIWNFPALKTLTLDRVDFPGNLSDTLAALVSLQNLKLHLLSLQDCYIHCPQLMNLNIRTCHYNCFDGIIVVLAPKLTNFTSVGIFSITFEDSKLDNVYIKLRGWIYGRNIPKKTLKGYYQRFVIMLPGLGSAKILHLELKTIKALSSISNFLVSSPSPFYNLKYVKLPHGFEVASLSSILKSYLLGGSPTATIVATLPQNIVPHAATASMTARNVVIEKALVAPAKLVDSKDIQKIACVDTVDVGVQVELVLQNSEVHADRVVPVGARVEGTCNDQVSSSRGNTDSGLWQGNEVNSEFVCLLDHILKKYPKTFENLTTKNKKFRTTKLNMLCTVVNDFAKIPMIEVDAEMIVEYMDVFADLKKLGFNVSWLVNHLNYIEQLRFSQPLPTKLHVTDCHYDYGKIEVQDSQICIDDAKTKLQDLQTLGSEKMQEIQKAHGSMDTNLVGCVGGDLLSGP